MFNSCNVHSNFVRERQKSWKKLIRHKPTHYPFLPFPKSNFSLAQWKILSSIAVEAQTNSLSFPFFSKIQFFSSSKFYHASSIAVEARSFKDGWWCGLQYKSLFSKGFTFIMQTRLHIAWQNMWVGIMQFPKQQGSCHPAQIWCLSCPFQSWCTLQSAPWDPVVGWCYSSIPISLLLLLAPHRNAVTPTTHQKGCKSLNTCLSFTSNKFTRTQRYSTMKLSIVLIRWEFTLRIYAISALVWNNASWKPLCYAP